MSFVVKDEEKAEEGGGGKVKEPEEELDENISVVTVTETADPPVILGHDAQEEEYFYNSKFVTNYSNSIRSELIRGDSKCIFRFQGFLVFILIDL